MTRREKQVAELHASGLTVRDIAARIGVSKTQVYSIMARLKLCPPRFEGDEPKTITLTAVTDANTSWCRGCGANVTKPCVLCRTRKEYGKKSGGSRGPASHDGRVVRQKVGNA